MKIKILTDTVCGGEFVKKGDVLDVNEFRGKNLIGMGKAEIHVPKAKEEPAKVEKAEKVDEAKAKPSKKAKAKDS